MKTIYIYRDHFFNGRASLGTCLIRDENCNRIFKSSSLERGWMDNERNVSCIPVGVYDVVLEYSPRFQKDLWEIKGVPNRSECKFHSANYWNQLNGCIALGKYEDFLDSDDVPDVVGSRSTMESFHKAMGEDTKAILEIYNLFQLV